MTTKDRAMAEENAGAGWIGVAASIDGLRRLSESDDLWWSLPKTAASGALIAMYATKTASAERQGIFGFFRVVGFDAKRDGECSKYGKGRRATSFVRLAVVKRLARSIPLKTLRADPVLGIAPCIRQNFQGTYFRLQCVEIERLKKIGPNRLRIAQTLAQDVSKLAVLTTLI